MVNKNYIFGKKLSGLHIYINIFLIAFIITVGGLLLLLLLLLLV